MNNPPSFSIELTQLEQEKAIRDGVYNSNDESFHENKFKQIHNLLAMKKKREV